MAGIYIHIPFCRQACHYCNFHFTTSLRFKDDVISSIIKETELQKGYLGNEKVETIYFGGGTPSLSVIAELKLIIEKIKAVHNLSADAEITLEANPDDITEEKLIAWKETGINRLSIGIQSFFEEDLRWMNRAHSAQQAVSSLQSAVKQFQNITVDLIYGTPYLTDENWKQNINTVLSLDIPHMSCYALTVEPNTPLDKMIRLHQTKTINPDKQSEQFLLLMQWLEQAGYEHYEISNFAQPGWRSRHNSSYWQGRKYLGIGPSAHSYNGAERQWNVANNNMYIKAIQQGNIPFEKEELTPLQRLNEYIMTSLRTIDGVNIETMEAEFSIAPQEMLSKAKRFIESGLVRLENNSLILTREGKLLADGIAAGLFF